ncbi:Protein of unknown function [Gryllus bimaculatus]|nr:Protein of unknown function [Gryllus bimaculatus]
MDKNCIINRNPIVIECRRGPKVTQPQIKNCVLQRVPNRNHDEKDLAKSPRVIHCKNAAESPGSKRSFSRKARITPAIYEENPLALERVRRACTSSAVRTEYYNDISCSFKSLHITTSEGANCRNTKSVPQLTTQHRCIAPINSFAGERKETGYKKDHLKYLYKRPMRSLSDTMVVNKRIHSNAEYFIDDSGDTSESDEDVAEEESEKMMDCDVYDLARNLVCQMTGRKPNKEDEVDGIPKVIT